MPMMMMMMTTTTPEAVYLSDLLGAPVRDPAGHAVGRLTDLLVPVELDYPSVTALCVKTGRETRAVAWNSVRAVADRGVVLAVALANTPAFERGDRSLSLAHQVLDRQIIDTNGVRVVRANDIQLALLDGSLRVMGIDVSTAGLLRRLGVGKPFRAIGIRPTPRTIAWEDIEPVETGSDGVRLRVARTDLARLRSADIAAILSQLDRAHSAEVLAQLDDAAAAGALGELHEDLQVGLIRGLEPERAADILEDMDPDEAADLLGDLAEEEPERAEDLLGRMEPEEAADVRDLLAYGDDSAGGLMTTDVITIPADVTAARAIELVRAEAAEMGSVYYVYAVDAAERLVGVLSLRELIVAPPSAPIGEVMRTDLVLAHAEDPAEEVGRQIARYNLLALPVVDAEGRIEGIVTVDDALDVMAPELWKSQSPRLYPRRR